MNGNFIEVVFTIVSSEDFLSDLLMNELADIGFESFESNELGFKAYIPSKNFDEAQLQQSLAQFQDQYTFGYEVNLIPYKNWNEVWESNFQAMTISDQVYIYADFHEVKDYPYQIKIHPKMAFGTGHHETTFQMAEQMLKLDLTNKSVLDMGCGTGILAILAHLKNAGPITAIDNDPIAADSAEENAALNGMNNATIECGDAASLVGRSFDVILANINRNILLNDMKQYSLSLNVGGSILFSGFYTEDLPIIQAEAALHDLSFVEAHSKNNWVVASFIKKTI